MTLSNTCLWIIIFIVGVLLIVMMYKNKKKDTSGGDPDDYAQYLLTAHGSLIHRGLHQIQNIKLPNNFVVVSICKYDALKQCDGEKIRRVLNNLSSSLSSISNFRDKLKYMYPNDIDPYGGICVSSGNIPPLNMVPNQHYSSTTEHNIGLYGHLVQLPMRRINTGGLDALKASTQDGPVPFIDATLSTATSTDPRTNRQYVRQNPNPTLASSASEYLKNVEIVGGQTLFDIIRMLSARNANKFTILFITSCQNLRTLDKDRTDTTSLDDYVKNIEKRDREIYRRDPHRTELPEIGLTRFRFGGPSRRGGPPPPPPLPLPLSSPGPPLARIVRLDPGDDSPVMV